ncbi:MAG: InlB B-repeat-containing protein [Clostridia bacterium]|nr:InlB B-repeat-containing protein [Clostridia bacterium]
MKKLSVVLLLVLTIALTACLVACDKNQHNNDNTPTTLSVTFEYGDGTATTQHVTYGGTVQKPQDPTKENNKFVGWYLAGEEFDFSTALTSDIRLAAKWEALPATLTVTFKSEGEEDNPVVVNRNDKASRPTNPKRDGYFFDGWYAGNDKYDFSKPVTEDVTVTAKWLTREQINETLSSAFQKNYSNYTSVRKVEEYYEGETYSYTITYKRTDSTATFVQVQEDLANMETIIPFDSNGNPVIVYYLDALNNKWEKSQNNSFGSYLIPLNFDAIEPDYFEYEEGRYFVLNDCAQYVEYALFGTMQDFFGLYLEIENGQIVKIGGGCYSFEGEFTQTIEEVGTTQITLPELPALDVKVTAKDEERTEGREIELSMILSMFTITVDGRTIEVKENMLNLGSLSLKKPAVGEYPITCTYTIKNGESYAKTATLTVVPAVESDLTLAEIFERDYSNMTIKYNGNDYLMNYGFMIYWVASTNHFYGVFEEGEFRLVRYNSNAQTIANASWQRMPRMDLFLALNPDLFVQDEEDKSVYVLDSSMNLDKDTLALLSAIFKQNEATANSSAVIDDDHGFFIKLTVNDNYIAQIEMTYYAKASASAKATEKTCTYEICEIGTTAEIEPSEEILQKLYPQN